MNFLWPEFLWLLLTVPVIVLVYQWLLRRQKKNALQYASLSLVKQALGAGPQMRRHVPPVLFLISLTLMLLAAARPTTMMTLPSRYDTVILAVDVSGSMRAADVAPNRLAAAQAAVRDFVAHQPHTTRVGVVSFAGTAMVVQPPTSQRNDILEAIDRFELQRGTAVGSGILVSLKAIFPDVEFDLSSLDPRPKGNRENTRAMPLRDTLKPYQPDASSQPVAPGSYTSAAIILLSDGQTTTGPDPVEASLMAAERGIRVYTVGIGTPDGEIVGGEGWSMRVRLDEDALKKIAEATDAEYFYAGNANELTKVYKTLNSRLALEKKETEITALFAATAALFALCSGVLSMLWFNRIV